jgi:hypothetical protein
MEHMSVLAGTSILRDLLGHISSSAQASFARVERGAGAADDLKHELGAFLAISLAAYDELRALSDEAATSSAAAPESASETIAGIRDANRAFVGACQPLLRLVAWARRSGAEPQRVDAFMSALGEADLIANRYDRVVESERQADDARTRALEDVRDELRRRVHTRGG